MSKKSGPNNPHGGAVVTVKSGPNNPHGGAAPVSSGPNNPHGGVSAVSQAGASTGSGAAAAEATEPEPETREETVSLRLSISEPEPFSVFISTDDKGGVQIESIEVEICDQDRPLFTTLVSSDLPVLLKNPAEPHVFPFSEEQIARLLPHLKRGESVEVKVHYLAPNNSQIRIGIIGRAHHNSLGRFIEHLFHRG